MVHSAYRIPEISFVRLAEYFGIKREEKRASVVSAQYSVFITETFCECDKKSLGALSFRYKIFL